MAVEQRQAGVEASFAGRSVSWIRVGIAVAIALILFKSVGGNFANEWEGWSVFFGNAAFVSVATMVLAALTFGLLVRMGLRPARDGGNRPARAAVPAGLIGILSYAIFFTGAPIIVGAGAATLGIEGLRRARVGMGGRTPSLVGLVLAWVNITFSLGFYATEIVRGVFPVDRRSLHGRRRRARPGYGG